ncbi:MAG: serine hydrolase [Pseudomonadota bacterium]
MSKLKVKNSACSIVAVFFAVLLLAIPNACGASQKKYVPVGFDSTVKAVMETWNVPGVAIAVVTKEHGSFTKGYGVRQWNQAAPVTQKTAFGIASITKTFIGVAIGTLIDNGEISLDDRVVDHLPSFQVADPWISQHITVRDLLSHRSGIETYNDIFEQFGNMSPRDVLYRMKKAGQSIDFRSGFEYNNIGFAILAELIRAKTGYSWDTYITDRLFKPLGMNNSYPSPRSFMKPNALFTSGDGWSEQTPRGLDTVTRDVAIPHAMWPRGTQELFLGPREANNRHIHIHVTGIDPSQSVFASANDMALWSEMLLNNGALNDIRILSEKTLKELRALTTVTSPQMLFETKNKNAHDKSFDNIGYGAGMAVASYGGEFCFGHTGLELGYEAKLVICPDVGVAVFVVVNNRLYISGSHQVIIQTLLDWHMRLPPTDWNKSIFAQSLKRQERVSANSQRLRNVSAKANFDKPVKPNDYVGLYSHPVVGNLTIRSTEAGLVARLSNEAGWVLTPFKADTFAAEWTGPRAYISLFNFLRSETGKVERVVVPDYQVTYTRQD